MVYEKIGWQFFPQGVQFFEMKAANVRESRDEIAEALPGGRKGEALSRKRRDWRDRR